MTAPAGQRKTLKYWYAGIAIDLLHMPILIAGVLLGASVFHGPIYTGMITLMVVLQVAVMGCPIMWLTGRLKRKHDPTYQGDWSLTYWLYQEYGRVVGVVVFVLFLALALLVRFLLF